MIIAQQMQHGMYRQIGNFALQAVAVQFGLFHGALHRNHDIAQNLAAVVLVDIILPVFCHGEAEHIGGGILIPVLLVQLVDAGVIHKGHADLCRAVKVFVFQHRIAAAADQDAKPRRNFDRVLLIGDQYFVRHRKSAS